MPLFTRENAADMARKGNLSRWTRWRQDQAARNAPPPAPPVADPTAEDLRKRRLEAQIDLVDSEIERTKDRPMLLKLIQAKARLWELLYPKPGSLKPRQTRRSGPGDVAQPVEPQEPTE